MGWQPSSLLYWGALGQLVGAFAFNVACAAGLPANAVGVSTHAGEVAFLYLPSLLGSALFFFASYVAVVEETHDYNCLVVPAAPTLGYAVVSLNLLGSLLFLVASAGYFCQVEPYGLYAGGQFGGRADLRVGRPLHLRRRLALLRRRRPRLVPGATLRYIAARKNFERRGIEGPDARHIRAQSCAVNVNASPRLQNQRLSARLAALCRSRSGSGCHGQLLSAPFDEAAFLQPH